MKKRISLFMITFMAAVCFSLSGVFAATYSKSKTASVSYNTQCTGRITDTASVNSSSLSWNFSLTGVTTSAKNGYTFASPYTSGITYTNERKKAIHNVGYYFFNSTGNHVGGNVKQFTFTYTSGSGVS